MSIEVMKQALEALGTCEEYEWTTDEDYGMLKTYDEKKVHAAITALRTAIAEAEKQEPVAWANINKHGDITHTNNKRMPWSKTPLYTTPPAAQPTNPDPLHLSRILHELAGAASMCWTPRPTGVFDSQEAIKNVVAAIDEIRTRSAAQRQWVGLTDEDLSVCDEDGVILARYWEAKLKEKNT